MHALAYAHLIYDGFNFHFIFNRIAGVGESDSALSYFLGTDILNFRSIAFSLTILRMVCRRRSNCRHTKLAYALLFFARKISCTHRAQSRPYLIYPPAFPWSSCFIEQSRGLITEYFSLQFCHSVRCLRIFEIFFSCMIPIDFHANLPARQNITENTNRVPIARLDYSWIALLNESGNYFFLALNSCLLVPL